LSCIVLEPVDGIYYLASRLIYRTEYVTVLHSSYLVTNKLGASGQPVVPITGTVAHTSRIVADNFPHRLLYSTLLQTRNRTRGNGFLLIILQGSFIGGHSRRINLCAKLDQFSIFRVLMKNT
jgi:hypothetical protein